MMRRAAVRVLAAMAIAGSEVSGCTRSVPRMPQPQPAGLLGVRPCPGIAGFSCGSLSVRLDPSGGAPGRLSLRVAVADAERFALAHPDRVRRLVLDSVVPTWTVAPLQLAGMREPATVLRDACAARRCGSDPAADLATVVRRYHDG